MSNRWEIYDALIDGIPSGPTVATYFSGPIWSSVTSDAGCGVAMTIADRSRPSQWSAGEVVGAQLKDVAQLVRSRNLPEAAIGMAAINAWYNSEERIATDPQLSIDSSTVTGFDRYADEIQGARVGVIGHFAALDNLPDTCHVTVFERRLRKGDYPDAAVEYLLPEQDFVFITASAFVNKTMPRLLELASGIPTVIIGPSTPLASCLTPHTVGLSGLLIDDTDYINSTLRGIGDGWPSRAGRYVTVR